MQSKIVHSQFRKKICHLDCTQSSIPAFVTSLCTGTFNGLFYGICCKNSENYRKTLIKADFGNPFRNFCSNIIKMRCTTPDNCSNTDNCIIILCSGHFLCSKRNLECTRNPYNSNCAFVCSMADKTIQGTFNQFTGNQFIKPSGNNTKPFFRTIKHSLYYG